MRTEAAPLESETGDSILELAASCYAGDLDGAAHAIVQRAAAGAGGYVCLCNVHVLTLALHESELRVALEEAWERLPDGAPVAWLQRRLGHEGVQRVGGPDVMPRVVELGRAADLSHFLLGSTPPVLERVERALLARAPGARIAGAHAPRFASTVGFDPVASEAIEASEARVVWCALGAPKQELWMRLHAARHRGVLFLGVGAAFDFLAGSKRRAPAWMRRSGLEWLHRLSSEPGRLAGRYLRTNSEFVLRTGFELARRRLAA